MNLTKKINKSYKRAEKTNERYFRKFAECRVDMMDDQELTEEVKDEITTSISKDMAAGYEMYRVFTLITGAWVGIMWYRIIRDIIKN